MKKLLTILMIGTMFLFNGCDDLSLDQKNFAELNPSTFPSNAGEAELLALEVYKPFSSRWPFGDGFPIFGLEEGHIQLFDAPTDLLVEFTSWGDGAVAWRGKSRGNFAPMVVQDRRRSHFEYVRFVTRTTKIIDDLQNTNVFANEEDRMQLIGEVRMARGLMMYYLLHLYGPVPVILDPALINTEAEGDVTRPPRSELVSAIAADMRFAADNLPVVAPNYGRFNKGMALTSLMRLYLNERDFQNAEMVGREIVAMNEYSLVDDYMSLFTEATERNSETIFAVSANSTSTGRGDEGNFNAYAFYTRPTDFTPGTPGWAAPPSQVFMATWDFFDSFDPNDERRNQLVGSYTATDGTKRDRTNLNGAVVLKYRNEGGFTGNDIPLARYADVLLMLAESINENSGGPTQEAIDLVNQIRNRAGLGNLPAADTQSKEAFNDAILRERGKEFFFEGLRKFDLGRMGEWQSKLAARPDKNPGPFLQPIPQYAVDDGVTQNDGY